MNELKKGDEVKKGNQTQHISNFSNKIPKGNGRKTFGFGQLQSFDTIK
jgi:hypothetical protein